MVNDFTVLLYWGGSIITNEEGIGYDRAHQRFISLDRNIRYQGLIRNLNDRAYIMHEGCIEKMTCRLPISVPPSPLIYTSLAIEDDEAFQVMMNIMDLNKFSCVHLYLDFSAHSSMQLDTNQSSARLGPFSSLLNHFDSTEGLSGKHSDAHDVPFTQSVTPLTPFHDGGSEIDITGIDDDYVPCGRDAHLFVEEDGNEDDDCFDFVETEGDEEASEDGIHEEHATLNHPEHEPMSSSFKEFDMSKVEEVCANNPKKYRPGSLWSPKAQEPMTSLVFPTRENLTDAVSIYSIHRNRVFRVTKTNAELWVSVCKVANEKGCKWYLRAMLKANLGLWMISRYTGPHTCLYASIGSDHPHLTSTLAAKVLMGHIKNNPDYKVTDIIETIKERFEMTISYRKACIVKNKAIQMAFGDWDDSYRQLPKFLTAMQYYNLGTVVKYVTSSTNLVDTRVLELVFWAMGGCIEGFKYCRPLITIDATFLKGKYKGVIMVANGVDANGQIFPLAFTIADGECKENWGFFLHNLRKHVVKDRADICLISDRGGGIVAAVNDHRNV